MRQLTIESFGLAKGPNKMEFDNATRWRVFTKSPIPPVMGPNNFQLELVDEALNDLFSRSKYKPEDIDLLVSTSGTGIQPIPSDSALIHERWLKGTNIPAMDIDTTCTSFITALDTVSYFMDAKRYKRVLIVAHDMASIGLNPDQPHSYKLFSDGAAAFLLEATDEEKGVVHARQATYSEGAHSTEIRGGLSHIPYNQLGAENVSDADYHFSMHGKEVLKLALKYLKPEFDTFLRDAELSVDDFKLVFPHQASSAIGPAMIRLGIAKGKYVDRVEELGNMVSASVPYILADALKNSEVGPGDLVALMGTAAGLTMSFLALQL